MKPRFLVIFLSALLLAASAVHPVWAVDMQAHVASDEAKAAYTTYLSKQTAYYTGNYTYTKMISQTGNTLFGTINTLMGNTCKNGTGFSYNKLRDQYINVDRDLNNSSNIIGYYDGSSFSGTWDNGETWNREHTWPQSKFGGSNSSGTSLPIGYDMQSVRPASTKVNSSRGNTAYGEGSAYYDPNEITINNANYNSINNGSYRGDCARVILYDYVVYGKWDTYSNSLYKASVDADLLTQIGSNSNSVFESLLILLKWHMEDPPSLTEMVRNDGGQAYQGNRNVFIDYPELAINMLKDQNGVTAYTVTYNMTETASPAYVYTTKYGFVTYLSDDSGNHPTAVNVTGATANYNATLGRLTLTNATGNVTISTTSAPVTPTTTITFAHSTVNVQIGATTNNAATANSGGAITYSSSNTNVATVSPTGVITGVAAGSCTITATVAANGDYPAKSTTCEVTVFNAADNYNVYWVVNWDYTNLFDSNTAPNGGKPTVPANEPECEGKVFMGWTHQASFSPSTGPTKIFKDGADANNIDNDPTYYYAVFATQNSSGTNESVTDELVKTTFIASSVTSTYTEFEDKSATSDAVYKGKIAGSNSSIQLRSSDNESGVVTTTSGGTAAKITVTWNNNTTDGRTLNIYGKNSAYSESSDLFDSSKRGELLGTIVCGTSTELEIEGSYTYIGFRSASGAMYLNQVDIEWTTGSSTTTYSNYTAECGETPEPCTQLTQPNVTAVPGDQQITLTWPEVEDAVSYTVIIDDGDGYTTECLATANIGEVTSTDGTCTCIITGLTNGLTYTTLVEAVAAETSCNSDVDEDTATPFADCQATVTVVTDNTDWGTVSVE